MTKILTPSPHPSPPRGCVIIRKEPTFRNGGEAVGWKRFRAVTFNLFGFKCSNSMNTFDLLSGTISHHLKDPHSKSLEPDCLFPINLRLRHSLRGERGRSLRLATEVRGVLVI